MVRRETQTPKVIFNFRMLKELVLISFIKPDGRKTLNKMKSKLTKIFLNTPKVRFYVQKCLFFKCKRCKKRTTYQKTEVGKLISYHPGIMA